MGEIVNLGSVSSAEFRQYQGGEEGEGVWGGGGEGGREGGEEEWNAQAFKYKMWRYFNV